MKRGADVSRRLSAIGGPGPAGTVVFGHPHQLGTYIRSGYFGCIRVLPVQAALHSSHIRDFAARQRPSGD